MKSGELFISCVVAKATWYCLDLSSPAKYPILHVTEDDVKCALREVTFDVKDSSVNPGQPYFVVSKD